MHRAIKAVLARTTYVPVLAVSDDALPAPRGNRTGAPVAQKAAPASSAIPLWEKLGLICSAHERRADDASRDVEAWLKSYFMRERVGDICSGTIATVVPFGVFVVLDDLFVEGLVHVSELGSEYFHFNEALHELRGERTGLRYRLADRLTVQVARVDLEARRIEFRLVRGNDRKALLQSASESEEQGKRKQKGTRKGESVAERRARQATAAARHGRDVDKRERARAGKNGLGGLRTGGGRGRGRAR